MILARCALLQEEPSGSIPDKDGDCSMASTAAMRLELRHDADFLVVLIHQDDVIVRGVGQHLMLIVFERATVGANGPRAIHDGPPPMQYIRLLLRRYHGRRLELDLGGVIEKVGHENHRHRGIVFTH
jgi:hypothetical protein